MAMDDVLGDLHGMSGAYALDALDPVEQARFEAHLATCAECREEVTGFRETAVLLAAAAAVAAPSPALRERVLAGVAQVRPLPPAVDPVGGTHRREVETPSAPPAPEPETNVVPLRRTPRRWLAAGIAAAVALIVGIGIGVVQPWHQGEQQQQVASLVDQVLAAPDARSVTHELGGGRVEIVRSAKVGRAVAIFNGVHAPKNAAKVYQLWLLDKGGAPVPAGLVGRGRTDQTVLLTGSAARAQSAAISREPTSGSKQPTTQPILFTFPA